MTLDLLEPTETAAPPPPARAHLRTPLVAAAAFASASGAGWAAAGLFAGVLAHVAAFVAAAIGAGGIAAANRTRRSTLVAALTGAVIVAFGVVLALAGGGGGIAGGIREAIRGGGPSGQPMPFDPGWRMLLVVLVGSVSAGATAIAVSASRPRLAVAVPVPVLIGASLVQPQGATLRSGVPAMAFLLAGLVVAYGIDLVADGTAEFRFEARRIVQGAIAIVLVAGVLFGVSHASFLFPTSEREHVIPPRLPPDVPPLPDRELFTVRSSSGGPWRLGVLDTYDGAAWRLPSFDPGRLRGVNGVIEPGSDASVTAEFTVRGLGGPVLPAPAGARRIDAGRLRVRFDPQTQTLRLVGETVPPGAVYTIAASKAPTGAELARAGAPAAAIKPFLFVPAVPPKVAAMLADAPRAPLWDRLQYARTLFYRSVVARGAGKPVAVPPARVDAILGGSPASPYEISAAEALIARWAGVPARIGYGFFGGDRAGAALSVHPRHAATWLEVYFEGHGWVPIVGVPPRARASLQQQRQTNPLIRPTDQLALVLYVPYKQRTLKAFYAVARFWVGIAIPLLAALALAWFFFPGALKLARGARRGRWARRRGERARVAVAYAEMRDAATDLNIGGPELTPFGFLDAVAEDGELHELTWLTSRALWGDLVRDPRAEDAELATRLARSVARRLKRAQPGTTRMLAIASRASLRDPYTREIPNVWPSRTNWVRRSIALAAVAVVAGSAGGVALARSEPQQPQRAIAARLPDRLVPAGEGTHAFVREPAVETRVREAGSESLLETVRVFTLRANAVVDGYLEVGAFGAGANASNPDVRRGVIAGITGANLRLQRAGSLRVYAASSSSQSYILWFAPEGTYFELLVTRAGFDRPLDLLGRVLQYQGRTIDLGGSASSLVPQDPRRGESL